MYFRFLALNSAREVIRGTIYARNRADAEREISKNGLEIQLLQVITEGRKRRSKNFLSSIFKRRNKLSSRSKQQFFQEMAILLRSGITIEHSLQIVINGRSQASSDCKIFANLLRNVQSGHALSDAMGILQPNFSYSEISVIRAGEQVGRVGDVMLQLAQSAKSVESIKNKLQLAMVYPGVVFAVTIFVMIMLNVMVLPQFKEVFLVQLGGELPNLTRLMINFCENFVKWAFFGSIILFLWRFFRKPKNSYGGLFYRLPVIKKVVNDYSLYLFSSILKMLLLCGVNFQQGLLVAKNVVLTEKLRKQVDYAIGDIHYGNSVAHALSGMFSRLAVGLISAGEQSGKLQETFDELAGMYQKSLVSRITVLSTLIEPLLIIFMALFVGLAVTSIFLPLLNLVNGVKL